MKKTKKVIVVLLCLVELLCIHLTYKAFKNKPVIIDDVKYSDNVVNKKMYGIFVEKSSYSSEQDKYEIYNGTTWPGSGYDFNDDKSICTDEEGNTISNALTYSNGTITLNATTSAYCYIYFDLIKPDITVVLQNYNEIHNTKSLNCTTGETNSPISSYYNTKYQALVFNDVKSTATNCTLASSNSTIDSTTLSNLSSYPYYLKNKVISVAVDETSETVTNSTNVTLNAGYRYEGTNPNNYIWFNNEMWRIIGVVPVCTSANCATKEDLVKIIRKDSIGSIAYDAKSSGYTGAWGSNTLYTLLNTKYWGKQDATDTATCSGDAATSKTKCDYTVIGLSSSGYYGNMVKQDVYWNTGASTNAANAKTVYGNESQTQQVQGNIGLMNASDYGYGSSESTRGNLSSYGTSVITLENWLYTNDSELTITQYTTASYVVRVLNSGSVNSYNAYVGNAVRPVLYLKDSVYVVNGDGSEATPYQVAIGS